MRRKLFPYVFLAAMALLSAGALTSSETLWSAAEAGASYSSVATAQIVSTPLDPLKQ